MNSNNYVKKMINILNLKDIKNHNLCIYNNRKWNKSYRWARKKINISILMLKKRLKIKLLIINNKLSAKIR